MKHEMVAIAVEDLFQRVHSDSDNFDLLQALGVNYPPLPGSASDADADWAWAVYIAAESLYVRRHYGKYVVVGWPEHVTGCRYNSDANYSAPMSRAEAEDITREFYGE